MGGVWRSVMGCSGGVVECCGVECGLGQRDWHMRFRFNVGDQLYSRNP